MKTIQEVEAWCEGAVAEFGDPSIPVCQLFVRYVEGDHRPARPDMFDLFCFRDADDYILFLGPDPDLVVPLRISGDKVIDNEGVRCYGAERITTGVWALSPSLNIPGVIHGFVTLYDVPRIPPWQRLVLLPDEVGA